ncbi:virulence protein-like protein [Microcella alkaliphila]|uniref:Virulence protein-like protein n=2 Tax=Microcella alkaliphila TaxID=279828 RepID=A0A0U5BN78_9MICO|nr:virulence protein-like protein [Microcella alkaliphila]
MWLTQAQMAELFQTTQQNISVHLKNIHADDELDVASTHKDFLSVRRESSRDVQRTLERFNLDAVLSVG